MCKDQKISTVHIHSNNLNPTPFYRSHMCRSGGSSTQILTDETIKATNHDRSYLHSPKLPSQTLSSPN